MCYAGFPAAASCGSAKAGDKARLSISIGMRVFKKISRPVAGATGDFFPGIFIDLVRIFLD
jgi:hypothetical protein